MRGNCTYILSWAEDIFVTLNDGQIFSVSRYTVSRLASRHVHQALSNNTVKFWPQVGIVGTTEYGQAHASSRLLSEYTGSVNDEDKVIAWVLVGMHLLKWQCSCKLRNTPNGAIKGNMFPAMILFRCVRTAIGLLLATKDMAVSNSLCKRIRIWMRFTVEDRRTE